MYIGEAGNVLDRLATHYSRFNKRLHDIPAMQQDWDRYGIEGFTATVIVCGPEWADREKRLAKEKLTLQQYKVEEVYNQHPDAKTSKSVENYRIVCEIRGQKFDSVGEASRILGESETDIRRKLVNRYQDYVILGKVKHGYRRIVANGKIYESINEAVTAGEAKTRFHAMRYLKDPNKKSWYYVEE